MKPLTLRQYEMIASPIICTIDWDDFNELAHRGLVVTWPDTAQPNGWAYGITPLGTIAVRVFEAWHAPATEPS